MSRNHDDEPVQPTRSAITVAGISGVSANKPRTLASTAANDVTAGVRSYFGGPSDFTALITVVREMPNLRAIAACGTSSAASLLISAQSSMVITLPMVSGCSLFTGVTVQFSSGVDSLGRRYAWRRNFAYMGLWKPGSTWRRIRDSKSWQARLEFSSQERIVALD